MSSFVKEFNKAQFVKTLNEVFCGNTGGFSKCRIQSIYDPKQDYAMYGLSERNWESAKKMLKSRGGQYFRKQKTGYGFVILCFKIKNNQLK